MMNLLMRFITTFSLLFSSVTIHSDFKIIDGDTVKVNGTNIRLLGINTPERGERCYYESKARLGQLINSSTTLKRDIVNKDKYGRELRHMFFEDVHLQDIMIHEGYAKVLCIWPNIKYCAELLESERKVIRNNVGCLFSKSNNTCIEISDLECEGSWVELKNICGMEVNISKVWIENRGRNRLKFEEILEAGELKKYFFNIYKNDAVYLFDNSGFIDFETC